MDTQQKIIAIIPARGGSKGLPRKNVRLLAGKPLIYYTIKEAKKSKYLHRLIVSTEDAEITGTARKYEAEVIERPVELAQDDTPAVKVCQQVVTYLEESDRLYTDIIVLLNPTSPCRLAEDIDRTIEMFLETNCDSVVSVCEAEHPPQWMFNIEGDRLKPIIKEWDKVTRRQDAPKTYRLNGAVFVLRRDVIMGQDKLMGDNIRPYIMPLERSVDIDTDLDFRMAEQMLTSVDR
ncbi:MAG: acylneuraminate cytidylyltransferase family protein [Dehalococcoidales bacterium]|nr:acylneuraminate cytidylyltransferase family protein [Dehalococcoidales bacterium]